MSGAGDRRRRGRLSRSGDFQRAYREGSSRANRILVLYAFPRAGEEEDEGTRLGVSVARKVGGAVDRNRVKRVLREAFWALGEELPDGYDFVIVARAEAAATIEATAAEEISAGIGELVAAATGGER